MKPPLIIDHLVIHSHPPWFFTAPSRCPWSLVFWEVWPAWLVATPPAAEALEEAGPGEAEPSRRSCLEDLHGGMG